MRRFVEVNCGLGLLSVRSDDYELGGSNWPGIHGIRTFLSVTRDEKMHVKKLNSTSYQDGRPDGLGPSAVFLGSFSGGLFQGLSAMELLWS